MTNYNQAMNELKNGNQEAAWNIAKTDAGLNDGVTKDKWIAHSLKVLASRAQDEANANVYYQFAN